MRSEDEVDSKDNIMFQQQALLEEFRALREEQMYSLRYRVWGIAVYAAISAGLYSFASDSEKSLICLAVIFLAVPFSYYTTYILRNSVRIGAYIYAMEEDDVNVTGLQWEHALTSWRDHVKVKDWRERKLGKWPFILTILGVYDIVAMCSWYLIFKMCGPVWQFKFGFIGIFFIALCHFHLGKIWDFDETEKMYREGFISFRKAMKKSKQKK